MDRVALTMSIDALRDAHGGAERPDGAGPAGGLGPAHDDAARGRAGPRRAARHAGAARARARHRPTRSASGWRRSRRRSSTGSTPRSCALARRDFDRARRVPGDLAAELERASAEGQTSGRPRARPSDFAAFAPALRRNVELAREYAACFDGVAPPVRRAAGRLRLRAHRRAPAGGLRRARRRRSPRSSPRRREGAAARQRRRSRRSGSRSPPCSRASARATTAGASTSPRTRSASASAAATAASRRATRRATCCR